MKTEISTPAFHSLELYPELHQLANNWKVIRDEAISSLHKMSIIEDNRTRQNKWRVLPIQPEKEDLHVFSKEILDSAKQLAPKTVKLINKIPNVKAYMFSALSSKSKIFLHKHENPYVTAMLCLKSEGDVYINNGSETQYFIEGKFIIFDYTMLHEVHNNSDTERIVLLVLLDNALLNK